MGSVIMLSLSFLILVICVLFLFYVTWSRYINFIYLFEEPTFGFVDFFLLIVCMLSCVRLFVTPWTTARQVPLSMRFSRQEYWSGPPFPPPGDGYSLTRDPACVFCNGRWILYHWATQEAPSYWSLLFHRSVGSDSLRSHGQQHARLPCPSPSPRACSNSCPLSQWCHPTILCLPLLLLPSVFPSIRAFSNELALGIHGSSWPKY